jgi:RimJ/RimL family protein N-acetyltransferase
MGQMIYDDGGQMVEWASKIIGFEPRPDVVAVGWRENSELRAVVLYDSFSKCDCNIHIASDEKTGWLSRAFLIAAFMHPFVQWDLRRVTGLVPAKNKKALRFDLHLGFKQEGYLRNALPDDDIIVLGMLREECKYIPQSHRV